jgi:Tol biopolymer transport system component
MKKAIWLTFLFFLSYGCSQKVPLLETHFPKNRILLEEYPPYLIGYCWQMPDGRKSINNPDDREVSIAISEITGEQQIIIRDRYNLPPHQLSDFFIYKAGCVEYGDKIRYLGNAISLGPKDGEISFVSGSDVNLTRFEFFQVDLEDSTYTEVNIPDFKEHNDYFFNPKRVLWSPDRSRVAALGMDTGSGSGNIWVYDVGLKEFIKATHFSGIHMLAAGAAWSDDSNKLAVGLGEAGGIQIVDLASNTHSASYLEVSHNTNPEIIGEWPFVYESPIQLLLGDEDIRFNKYVFTTSIPMWISNTKIIFAAPELDGYSSLFIVNADGSDLRKLLENLAGNIFMPALSPNRSRLSFVRYPDWEKKNRVEIGLIDLSTLEVSSLIVVESVDKTTPLLVSGMAWSPDGNYLTFSSNHAGESDVYVISSDGNDWLNVTEDIDGNAVSPFWISR